MEINLRENILNYKEYGDSNSFNELFYYFEVEIKKKANLLCRWTNWKYCFKDAKAELSLKFFYLIRDFKLKDRSDDEIEGYIKKSLRNKAVDLLKSYIIECKKSLIYSENLEKFIKGEESEFFNLEFTELFRKYLTEKQKKCYGSFLDERKKKY